MTRVSSFGAGMILVAALSYVALGTDHRPSCVHGHPAKRAEHVTYGGLPGLQGYQRDHWVPLELGGADTRDNVHYQVCALFGDQGRCLEGPAAEKDDDEHYAGHMYCSSRWSLEEAQHWLAARWSIDPEHGYNRE